MAFLTGIVIGCLVLNFLFVGYWGWKSHLLIKGIFQSHRMTARQRRTFQRFLKRQTPGKGRNPRTNKPWHLWKLPALKEGVKEGVMVDYGSQGMVRKDPGEGEKKVEKPPPKG